MKHLLRLLLLFISPSLFGQGTDEVVLGFEEYLDMVVKNHPIAQVANIQIDEAEALLLAARGGFDPTAQVSYSSKDFQSSNYYNLVNAGVKIPTWLGLTAEGGIERNEGLYLNPENLTPDQGQVYAGLSLTLGKGLFIDERRAELSKARIAQDLAETERQLLMNELCNKAGMAYWEWFRAYQISIAYEEVARLAQTRFQAVKESAILGDRPYIDTLEASIQVQNRTLQMNQSRLDAENMASYLSVFLWLDGTIPMELDENTVPIKAIDAVGLKPADNVMLQMDSLIEAHPELMSYGFGLDQLDIDRRLKLEQLKPSLDLKYNALSQSISNLDAASLNARDYAVGLEFSMPLFLRKERGALKRTDLKILEQKMKQTNSRQKIRTEAQVALNTQSTTAEQIEVFKRTVDDYRDLLAGERTLFFSGESSLFMVNSRESGYLDAQIKLIELQTKNRISDLKSRYALSIITPDS